MNNPGAAHFSMNNPGAAHFSMNNPGAAHWTGKRFNMSDEVTKNQEAGNEPINSESKNPMWKIWLWTVGRFTFVWGAFTALFASTTVCPFCGGQGCPAGAGIYGAIVAVVYSLLRLRKKPKSTVDENTSDKT